MKIRKSTTHSLLNLNYDRIFSPICLRSNFCCDFFSSKISNLLDFLLSSCYNHILAIKVYFGFDFQRIRWNSILLLEINQNSNRGVNQNPNLCKLLRIKRINELNWMILHEKRKQNSFITHCQ